MKKLITILVLLTLSNILIAQDSIPRFQLGVNGFYSYNGIGNNSNINASIVAGYGRHSVNAGIILASGLDVLQAGYKPGFQFGYQFYPVRKQKIFNSFIAYDIDVINAKITNKYPTVYSGHSDPPFRDTDPPLSEVQFFKEHFKEHREDANLSFFS